MPAVPSAELEEVRHTVLLTTVHNLHDTPNYLASPVSTAARKTTESLQIVILSPFFNPPAPPSPTAPGSDAPTGTPAADAPGISRTACWDDVQRLLTFAYVQATAAAQERGRVLLDIDVLLRGTAEAFPEEVLTGAGRIYLGAFVYLWFCPLFFVLTPGGVRSPSPRFLLLGSAVGQQCLPIDA